MLPVHCTGVTLSPVNDALSIIQQCVGACRYVALQVTNHHGARLLVGVQLRHPATTATVVTAAVQWWSKAQADHSLHTMTVVSTVLHTLQSPTSWVGWHPSFMPNHYPQHSVRHFPPPTLY
jgi:hypothetical protein